MNIQSSFIIMAALACALVCACSHSVRQNEEQAMKWRDRDFYSIQATMLDGTPADFSSCRGKVVLVVNVASRCGFTGQYAGLQKLNDKYKGGGLVVLGVPSNDFGGQEPGSDAQIKEFCSSKYSVTFPMLSKEQIKSGAGQCDLYQFLEARTGKLPGWNFSKYLVDSQGKPVAFYPSTVAPDDQLLADAIERALANASTSAPTNRAEGVPSAK